MKEVDSDTMFAHWLKGAKRGEKVVYFDGFLMREREIAIRSGFFVDTLPARFKAATAAWKAYLDGAVILAQHKRGEGEYEYIAVKR